MKKITLFFFALFAILWQSYGQVQVGSGTTTTTSLPLWSCWGYTYSQQIYYQGEINAQGDITALSFYYDSGPFNNSLDWTIYMGHTTKTEFTSTTDWEPIGSLTEVYTGTVTFPAAGNWMQITLDTPFSYNNMDNLIIALDENQANFDCSVSWQKTDTPVNRGIAYRADGTNPDPATPPTATSIFTFYPNVILEGIQQACPTPNMLGVGTVTSDSAELTWTENGVATTWNIEVVTAGTTPTGTATDIADTNPFTVSGLTPATDYEYYIQADCGAGELSGWMGPFPFVTACSIFIPPYLQEFTTIPANCWEIADAGDPTTGPQTIGTSAWYQDGFANQGFTGAYSINLWLAAKSDWLLSPEFDLTGGPFQVELDLAIMQFGSSINAGTLGSDDQVQLLITSDGGATWTPLLTWDNTSTVPVGGEHYVNNLSAYSGSIVQFGIWASEGVVDDSSDNEISIDNFEVRMVPTCPEPTGLAVNNFPPMGNVEVAWTENGSATTWNIEYGPEGFTPGTGTTVNGVTDNPYYGITGLTADTSYDFYVQADCGPGDLSEWTGPTTLFVGYCQSVPTSFDGQGVTNVTIVSTDFPSLGNVSYEDHTATVVDVYQAIMTNLQVTFATGFTYNTNVWIDFNDNLVFEASELVFAGESTNANPTTLDASFLMPLTASLGTHRMRIGTADGGQFTPNPCYNGAWGVTLDFTVNVNPAPACIPPSNLAAVSTSMSTADFSWTENNPGVTTWNIEYGPDGFTPGTGTIVTATSDNPFEATGLAVDTDYDFYVQSDCGATDGLSIWSGPFSFFHGYCQSIPTSNDGNGVANVQLNTAQFPSLGDVTYENHTATVVNIFQGLDIPLFVTFETGFTYDTNVWIDFNDDLVFDASEIVFTGTSLNTNPTTLDCSFLLDAAAPLGIHRMRIGTSDFGQVPPAPCYTGNFGVTLDFTVNIVELTCDLFEAEYTVIDDCANGDQFLIEVNVTDLGSASSLTIANNIDATTWPVPAVGTYVVGPFPFQQNVYLSVSNDQDNNCTLLSPTFNLLGCPPANDECVDSVLATVNLDDECTILNPGTILGATPSNEPAGTCTGSPNDDVWFHFVAENDTQIIQLLNIAGTTTDLDFAVYDGTCGAFTEILCSAATTQIVNNLTVGNTYYVRVFSGGSGSYTTTFDLCIKYHGGVVTVTQNVDEFPSEQEWVEDLVENVLLSSACAQVSNITYSTGTNFGSENGIGYFTTNSQTFPFADGIVLATANAVDMTGPKGGPINGGAFDWPGDTDLFNYIDGLGIDPGLSDYNNATILEFDFVPYNNEMSFDFLFASDEYGTFQCDYSDAFAFFLTDMSTSVTTNLALVPGTNDPISVITIRDNTYNTGCSSVNDQYFDAYYGFGGEDPIVAPINLNGTTVQMTAQSAVIPYNTYHIKLVIADRNDTAFDSAVFLSGGSFEIGEPDLGVDITIADGTATCYGNSVILDTGYVGVPHTWYFGGFEISGETSNTLEVTEPGDYAVQLVYSPTCAPYDEILVEFLPLPEIVADPMDVQACDDSGTGTYDLTANNAGILGTQNPADFTITVHPTEQDAIDNTAEMSSPYTGAPQTVFIRIEDNATSCYNIASFDLVFYPNPTFTQPGDLGGCDSDLDGDGEFYLTDQDALILNGQTDLTITYHASQADADGGTAALPVPYEALPGVVYVRIEDNTTGCYSTTSYNLVLNANPTVVTPDDMEACSDDDGYAVYDLESQTSVVTGGNTNYTVTYHDTDVDAIAGSNALVSPYEAMPPQTIYVRVVDATTGCYTITDFDLIAYPYEDPSFDYGTISLLPCDETPVAVIYGLQGGVFTIDVNGDSNVSIDASTGQILNGASGASYVVTYTTTGPCPQSSSMTVDFEQCVFPQAISPNGDGLNDNFDLSSFDVQKLEVFNRYGALVYSKTDYTNEWHGQSDSGDELPVGTYYYVIRYQGGKEKAAWVYINK